MGTPRGERLGHFQCVRGSSKVCARCGKDVHVDVKEVERGRWPYMNDILTRVRLSNELFLPTICPSVFDLSRVASKDSDHVFK